MHLTWPRVKGTALLQVGSSREEEEKALRAAAEILLRGGLVAFPTETVYGLGANALDPDAVKEIFKVKRRPADNPLIVHVTGLEQAGALVENIPPEAVRLAQQFWPGPLTLVLPKKKVVPEIITAGLFSVAVRVPAHPLALKLIQATGFPLAAPSANLSGRPSPTTAAHVLEDLAGRIEAVLDGGPCTIGLESTVLSLLSSPPVLLRPGGVTLVKLEEVCGKKILDLSSAGEKGNDWESVPRSPGMKYRHYAPRAPLYLVEGAEHEQGRQLVALCESLAGKGRRVGVILFAESRGLFPSPSPSSAFLSPLPVVEVLSSRKDPHGAAERLFGVLRRLEAQGVDVIVVEGFEEEGIGRAVMNRLRKAATEIIQAEAE